MYNTISKTYCEQLFKSSLLSFSIWEEMHVFCISYYVDICKLITTKKKKNQGAFVLSL